MFPVASVQQREILGLAGKIRVEQAVVWLGVQGALQNQLEPCLTDSGYSGGAVSPLHTGHKSVDLAWGLDCSANLTVSGRSSKWKRSFQEAASRYYHLTLPGCHSTHDPPTQQTANV